MMKIAQKNLFKKTNLLNHNKCNNQFNFAKNYSKLQTKTFLFAPQQTFTTIFHFQQRGYAKKSSKTSGHSSLESVLQDIENNFGKGTVMRLGSTHPASYQHDVVSSGSLTLDSALGIGGFPRGRIVEIFGPESSGKTTLALHVIAQAQKKGGTCTFIDAEHALDPVYCRRLGVNVDELFVTQPNCGEQALEIADALVKSGSMDVVVVDSVAALVPRAELEGQIGDLQIGLQARLMSQALRILTASIANSKAILIFINQIRNKIGVMFGNPEVTSGGNALKFYSSIRLDVRRIATNKKGEESVGNQIKVTVAKNKLAPPFQKAIFDIDFGSGISKSGELVDLGVIHDVVEKSGAWYSYKGNKIGQGREKVKQYLQDNIPVAEEIEAELRKKIFVEGKKVTSVTTEADDVIPEAEEEEEVPTH